MRDLVRALQQAEYGLRTGDIALEDLDKACQNANALHERLVVIRHKAREAHVREQAAQAQAAKAQAPKPEPVKAEPPRSEAPVPEPMKVEMPKAEAPKADSALVEMPKAEPVAEKTAPTKTEAAKPEIQKAEAPMAETPKPEVWKVEAPVAESPKPAPPPPQQKAPKPEPAEPAVVEAVAAKTPATVTAIKLDTRPTEKKESEVDTAVAETEEAAGAKTAAEFLAAFRAGAAPKPTPTLAEKMEKAHIDDLLKAISISDRFWFTKELFNGEKSAFEKAVSQMNAASSIEEASNLLSKAIIVNPKKPANPDARTTFLELLQRRFA
ncbi:MAG: hypothetical protein IPL52_14390 [Flavobacteriales bacterium]|nr:hypothetical protein [Flavobacteriales bacterium]